MYAYIHTQTHTYPTDCGSKKPIIFPFFGNWKSEMTDPKSDILNMSIFVVGGNNPYLFLFGQIGRLESPIPQQTRNNLKSDS